MSPQHPDQYYIEAIRQGDSAALRQLIAECFPPVKGWVCQNSGTLADAEDVFGDALEAICRKLQQGKTIELTARFSTFIFKICKNQWLKRLRKKKPESEVRSDDREVLNLNADDWNGALEASERMQFIRKKFSRLSKSCQGLLKLCWADEKKSMGEIAAILGFGSAGYTSKRKHECIEKLRKIIWEDPDAKQYL